MDPQTSGRTARRLEPLHALGYFAPEVEAELVGLGIRTGRGVYFASRSAAMGRVGPGTVAATFYVFNPGLVAHFVPQVWEAASPQDVVAARYRGVHAALRRLVGDEVLDSPEVAEAAQLARTASAGCTVAGRPLYAAHAELDWPQAPAMVLFHALTLLREHRGDGHVAALQAAGLSGLEALVTHTATGRGFTVPAAKRTRGWTDEEWGTAESDLAARDLLDSLGAPTADGAALRTEIEADTDRLGAAPWDSLGEEGVSRLAALAVPVSHRALKAGAFPAGVFA